MNFCTASLFCPVIDARSDDINAQARFCCDVSNVMGDGVTITWWFAKNFSSTPTEIVPSLQQGTMFFAESRNVLIVRNVGADFEGVFQCNVTVRGTSSLMTVGCLYVLGKSSSYAHCCGGLPATPCLWPCPREEKREKA
jgi:hypothetical protein